MLKMHNRRPMQTITTTIKREYLKEIIAKRKTVEYREIKDYWENRFRGVETPFLLRLINGMSKTAPEVTVAVTKIDRNRHKGRFELRLGRIHQVKNWDRRREQPAY